MYIGDHIKSVLFVKRWVSLSLLTCYPGQLEVWRSRHGHLWHSQRVHLSWRLHGRGVFCWRGEVNLILKVVFKLLNKILWVRNYDFAFWFGLFVLKFRIYRVIILKGCGYDYRCIQNSIACCKGNFKWLFLWNHTGLKLFMRNSCGFWPSQHGMRPTLKLISRSLQQVTQLNSTTTVATRTDTDTTSKRFRGKFCSSGKSPAEATQNITAWKGTVKAYFFHWCILRF